MKRTHPQATDLDALRDMALFMMRNSLRATYPFVGYPQRTPLPRGGNGASGTFSWSIRTIVSGQCGKCAAALRECANWPTRASSSQVETISHRFDTSASIVATRCNS